MPVAVVLPDADERHSGREPLGQRGIEALLRAVVPHFQHVHTAGWQPVGQLTQLLGLGIAREQGRPLRRAVAIAVPEGEQAETVGVTSIVGQTFRPQHRQREPATAPVSYTHLDVYKRQM